jgi:hypothetical protein
MFDRLQIGLTGSVEPDNFTIEIYEWDVATSTELLRRTVGTNVTRTTPAIFNGGTLNGNDYGIGRVAGNDYYLKLTADNSCKSNATFSLREPAYALSVHAQVIISTNHGSANPIATVFQGFPNPVTSSSAWQDIANFDDVFYLADDAPSFPTVGAGMTFSTNFSFAHLGTYDLNDTLVSTGKWASGMLNISSFTLEQDQTSPYKTYRVYAQQTSGIEADTSGTTYYSRYRITFNPSNTSRTFIVYWVGATI